MFDRFKNSQFLPLGNEGNEVIHGHDGDIFWDVLP